MREDRPRQLLCSSADVVDGGEAVRFELLANGQPASAFVLRTEGGLRAYLNRCAHVPTELDWQRGQFWCADRRFIICSVHGALYDPPDGLCVAGPCVGARLHAIAVVEESSWVYWYPHDWIQPLF